MQDLKQQLLEEGLSCIVKQKDSIYKEHAHGILPLLHFIEQDLLKDSILVDKVIGKAAAMLMVYGGVKKIHALIISEHALQILQAHNISISYDTLVPYIINRNKDGMCPMEQAVLSIQDIDQAYQLLVDKVMH